MLLMDYIYGVSFFVKEFSNNFLEELCYPIPHKFASDSNKNEEEPLILTHKFQVPWNTPHCHRLT